MQAIVAHIAQEIRVTPAQVQVAGGQYQHDVTQSELARTLDAVVEGCGETHGAFANRQQLQQIMVQTGQGVDALMGHADRLKGLRPEMFASALP